MPLARSEQWLAFALLLILGGLMFSRAAISWGVIMLSIGIFLPGRSWQRVPAWAWLGLILVGLYALSLGLSLPSTTGWEEAVEKIPLALCPLVLASVERLPARTVRGLLWSLVLIASLGMLVMLSMAASRSVAIGLDWHMALDCLGGQCEQAEIWYRALAFFAYSDLSGGLDHHPGYLSLLLLFVLLVQVWLWDDARLRRDPFPHWWMGLSTGLVYLFIALLSSRMHQLIFIGVLLFLAVYVLRGRMSWKQFLLPLAVVGGLFGGTQLLSPVSKARMAEVTDMTEEETGKEVDQNLAETGGAKEEVWTGMSVRRAVWTSAAGILKHAWLGGLGAGTFREELVEQYRRDGFLYGYERRLDPHNQYLATWLALGLPGLLVLLAWLAGQFSMAWQRRQWYALLWVISCCAAMLTETLLGRQVGVVFVGVLVPLLLFHLPKAGTVPGAGKE